MLNLHQFWKLLQRTITRTLSRNSDEPCHRIFAIFRKTNRNYSVSLINIGNYTSYTLKLYPKTTKDRGEKMVNMYDTTAVDIN